MEVLNEANAPTMSTPNAVMRIYASPSVNGAPVAVWRTDMRAGARGPRHAASQDQVLIVLDGAASVDIDGTVLSLSRGDSLLLPRGLGRQVSCAAETLSTLTCGLPAAEATVEGQDPVPIPWTR